MSLWKHQGPEGAVISFESLVEAPPPSEAGGRGALAGRGRGGGRGARAPGPGPVRVGQAVPILTEGPNADKGAFRATFDMPGEYVIRIRIDNFSQRDSTPGNQCCWSNAYVRVTVTE